MTGTQATRLILLWMNFLFLLILNKASAQDSLSFRVYFDLDSDHILSRESDSLQAALSILPESKPVKSIHIQATCDDRGSEAYNKKLAARRVKAVQVLFPDTLKQNPMLWQVKIVGEVPLRGVQDTAHQRALNRK